MGHARVVARILGRSERGEVRALRLEAAGRDPVDVVAGRGRMEHGDARRDAWLGEDVEVPRQEAERIQRARPSHGDAVGRRALLAVARA